MRFPKMLLVLTIFLSLSAVAYAHSGKTDNNGGHIDHSTGQYHYHHGYSAHQHRDLDGDGDLDCPYSFNDKTDSSNSKTEKTGSVAKKVKDYLLPILCCFVLYGVVLLVGKIKERFEK